MTFPLDRRTRYDADNRPISPDEFFDKELPEHLARHGALVAKGMVALDARPLAIEVGHRAWSFTSDGETVDVHEGVVDDAFVVTLTEELFSDWVQQQRSFNGMVVGRLLQSRNGSEHDVSVWDSLWLTMLEGWPVVDDDLQFLDRHGAPLDLHQHFTPDDDPADVAHFVREAGFLHLRGWVDPALMATVSEDIDRAVPHYTDGDGRSWWADLEDGTHTCVRLQEFLGHSPTTESILRSELWDQLRRTVAGDDDLVQAPVEGRCLEALIKPVGVVAGASDVSFHRDCHLGRHAYGCSGMVAGIAVSPTSEENGFLQVVAGSHRVAIPVEVAKRAPYLPVVGLPTEPGDVTIHLSCTLHQSLPPRTAERKVMYGGGFSLAPRAGDIPGGGAHLSELRENVYKILLDESASDAAAERIR
ncbi:MAG: phytanoyl-CoA dioxygenase family protein [Acidimicrobiales bacterium]